MGNLSLYRNTFKDVEFQVYLSSTMVFIKPQCP